MRLQRLAYRPTIATILILKVGRLNAQTLSGASSIVAGLVCDSMVGCMEGPVTSNAGILLTVPTTNVSSANSSVLLLPGTYTSSFALNSGLQPFTSSSIATSLPFTGFSISRSSSVVDVTQVSSLVTYSNTFFSGSSSLLEFNNSFIRNATSLSTPQSILLSANIYAVAKVPTSGSGTDRLVIRSGIPDVNQLPIQLASGDWTITDLQGSNCSPACASGGICSLTGVCICSDGFTGTSCSQCASGHFGPDCGACPDCPNGTCDEGITGTGRCVPNAVSAAAAICGCTYGICDAAAGDCTCSPGWADASEGRQCSVCQAGYFLDSEGDCVACAPGCTACAAGSGTCTTCTNGLQVSEDNPQTCIASRFLPSNGTTFTSCSDRTFLASNQTCSACNPACTSCSGPNANQCLGCASGKGLLQGTCVAVDSSTGICDGSALNSNQTLAYIFSNEKQECDTLPAGCTSGATPIFSASSTRADIRCTECLTGLLLYGGRCVTNCTDGFFASNDSGLTCQACSPGCGTCEGSSDYCLSCPSGKFAINGTCITASACPTGYFQTNSSSSCTPCHPDCGNCAGAFDQCTSCSTGRPILTSLKSCVSTCSSNQYYAISSETCENCDSSCDSCAGAGTSQCLSCSAERVLTQGVCMTATCNATTSLGVCLEDMLNSHPKSSLKKANTASKLSSWEYVLIVLGLILIVAFAIALWRMKAIKQRMAKTQGFQAKKGLFGFLRPKAKPEVVSGKTAALDHIPMVRSPTPPPYSYNPPNPEATHSKNCSTPQPSMNQRHIQPTFSDIYSVKGESNGFVSRESANSDSRSSIVWPHPVPTQVPHYFQERPSSTSSTYSHLSSYNDLSLNLRSENQKAKRQKALETLTRAERLGQ